MRQQSATFATDSICELKVISMDTEMSHSAQGILLWDNYDKSSLGHK